MVLQDPVLYNNFNEINARANLKSTEFTVAHAPVIVIEEGEHKVVSLDDRSHFELPKVQVESIEHFAHIANGDWRNPSTDLERRSATHPRLSAKLHPKDLAAQDIGDWMVRAENGIEAFSPEEKFALYEAVSVVMHGDGELIKNLAAVANHLFFPTPMGLFTAEHLLLKDHAQLSFLGDAPVFMNVGKLELQGTSTIHVHAPLIGFAQMTDLTGRDQRAELMGEETKHGLYENPTFNYVLAQEPQAQDGAGGEHGSQPAKATPNGKSHKSKSGNCPYVCDTEPGAGEQGGKGYDGDCGTPGNDGASRTNTSSIDLFKISGVCTLNYGGATGQQGGKGGDGGPGGEGGQPGDSATGCSIKTQGPQGPGGIGGRGGDGGKGGSSVTTKLVWEGNATVSVGYNLDNGGAAGAAGLGGGGQPKGESKGAGTPGAPTPPGNLILPPTQS